MQRCWHSGRRAQTYLTCPYPTYRLCLSLSLPTPLICKTQFSPKLIFFSFFFSFYSYSPGGNSSPNPLYRHCPANLTVTYHSQSLRSLPRGERGRASVLYRGPTQASGWPPRSSAVNSPKWVQRPTTRAKGWMVRRGTLPKLAYPFKLETPPGLYKRLTLKLLVLATKIPVACVGVHTNSGHAHKFSPRALARSHGWDAWLPWQELSPADSLTMAPPGTTLPPSLPAP